jgi:hypothetical protein
MTSGHTRWHDAILTDSHCPVSLQIRNQVDWQAAYEIHHPE